MVSLAFVTTSGLLRFGVANRDYFDYNSSWCPQSCLLYMGLEIINTVGCFPAQRTGFHVCPRVRMLVAMEWLGGGVHLGAVGTLVELFVWTGGGGAVRHFWEGVRDGERRWGAYTCATTGFIFVSFIHWTKIEHFLSIMKTSLCRNNTHGTHRK